MSKDVSLRSLVNPTPKQVEFLAAVRDHLYTLYGGAAGGGKSYILRWAMVWRLLLRAQRGLRGVRVGLFCEDYPALRERHLSKIRYEFPSWLGRLRENVHEFELAPEYGAGVIAFRNLADPSTYLSAEFADIAVDELTRNQRAVFDMLRTRLRWPGVEDSRFLAATNPGQKGHGWVRKLWVVRDFTGEPAQLKPGDFAYVPAKAADNPHLPPAYLESLASLPEDLRRAYLEGDWDIFQGQVFTEWRQAIHVVTPQQVPLQPHWRRFRMMDWGYNDPTTCLWAAVTDDGGLLIYRELVERGMRPTAIAERVLAASGVPFEPEPIDYTVIDSQVWQHNISGEIVGETLAAAGLVTIPADKGPGSRIAGKQRLHEWLAPYPGPDGRTTARLLVYSSCVNLIREIPSLVYDELHVEDVDDESGATGHADLYAALRYGLMSRPEPGEVPRARQESADPVERVAEREARWLERMNEKEFAEPKKRGYW